MKLKEYDLQVALGTIEISFERKLLGSVASEIDFGDNGDFSVVGQVNKELFILTVNGTEYNSDDYPWIGKVHYDLTEVHNSQGNIMKDHCEMHIYDDDMLNPDRKELVFAEWTRENLIKEGILI